MKKLSRRNFFTGILGTSLFWLGSKASAKAADIAPTRKSRAADLERLRRKDIRRAVRNSRVKHRHNQEERDYPFIANFSKALPHDSLGQVSKSVYRIYLRALRDQDFSALGKLPIGIARLANPQAGIEFTLEGPDSAQLELKPAPRIDRSRFAGEMGELYWQALTRDVHFSDYSTDSLVSVAVNDLNSSFSNFKGPTVNGAITPDTIFRGTLPGDNQGPYVSQFLLQDIQTGSLTINQKQRTVPAGFDHMTSFDNWLVIQDGQLFKNTDSFDSETRYIRNGRDLCEYVHEDNVIQAYYNAASYLLDLDVPHFDKGNPLFRQAYSDVFASFGKGHIVALLGEVIKLALHAAWFQKWYVHRRLRPEAAAGLIHNQLTGTMSTPIHSEALNFEALNRVFSQHGTYLLPQAYPEGCPTHPSYPAGHAVTAGACVTILKAFFNEDFPFEKSFMASDDGLSLVEYTGADAQQLTVGSELNKLASNICLGRNWAGIHYRTDATGGLNLGQNIAIALLRSQRDIYKQKYSFSFTKFNGQKVTIGN